MRYALSSIAIMLALTTQQASAASHSASTAAGQQAYEKNCASCHRSENPRLGDKAAWEPLFAKGTEALVASVINGKGTMPPHGGKPRLPHSDIEAAVIYMMEKSK